MGIHNSPKAIKMSLLSVMSCSKTLFVVTKLGDRGKNPELKQPDPLTKNFQTREHLQNENRNPYKNLWTASGLHPSPVRVASRRRIGADENGGNLSGIAAGVPVVAARPALRSGFVQTLEAPGVTRGLLVFRRNQASQPKSLPSFEGRVDGRGQFGGLRLGSAGKSGR